MGQIGHAYVGTKGFPLFLTLRGLIQTDLGEIINGTLLFTRPDATTFQTPITPDNITNGAIQYVFQDGDLSVAGRYKWFLSLNMTGNRVLTTTDFFKVRS